jgi:hypothetical protein
MPKGQCHCGPIRYELQGEPKWTALWMENAHELPAFARYPSPG